MMRDDFRYLISTARLDALLLKRRAAVQHRCVLAWSTASRDALERWRAAARVRYMRIVLCVEPAHYTRLVHCNMCRADVYVAGLPAGFSRAGLPAGFSRADFPGARYYAELIVPTVHMCVRCRDRERWPRLFGRGGALCALGDISATTAAGIPVSRGRLGRK